MAKEKWPTKEELEKARKDGKYSWLGNAFWKAFVTLPKRSAIRRYHSEVWDSMSKAEQEACEDC